MIGFPSALRLTPRMACYRPQASKASRGGCNFRTVYGAPFPWDDIWDRAVT